MAYHKVEICGVNTAKLRVLKEQEKMELLRRMRQGDPDARRQLVEGNLRLVLSVTQRFSGRGENPDDLFQVGCIGLMKAIDHFDTGQNVRFSTYAVPMILGEIRRYLRDNSAVRVSRSLKDVAYRAMQTKERMLGENRREPTVEEIAAEMGAAKEDVVLALEAIVEPISLYEPVYSDGGDTLFVMDQLRDRTDDGNWEGQVAFRDAVAKLSPRERNILYLRFQVGKTQVEVAEEIGISQAQVSRLEKGAVNKIKAGL